MNELLDASNGWASVKRREDMQDGGVNKAFAHYRW